MARFQHPRMDALGHNLPEDVQWRIFSFEQHPTAVLIKTLRFTYHGSPFRNDRGMALTLTGGEGVFKDLILGNHRWKRSALRFFYTRPGKKELTARGYHFGIVPRFPSFVDSSDVDSDTSEASDASSVDINTVLMLMRQ